MIRHHLSKLTVLGIVAFAVVTTCALTLILLRAPPTPLSPLVGFVALMTVVLAMVGLKYHWMSLRTFCVAVLLIGLGAGGLAWLWYPY